MRVWLVLAAWLLVVFPGHASALDLKVATWNIAWATAEPARAPRTVTPRSAEDWRRLQAYAVQLAADVVALQEVDGPEAARLVFEPSRWQLHFSDETDTQRTGFAVRRGLALERNPDLAGLDLNPDARFSLRRGADITVVTPAGSRLRLLSVHLKAGCEFSPLDDRGREDCQVLARQVPPLQGWIRQVAREGTPFLILGDFNRRLGRQGDEVLRALNAAAPLLHANAAMASPCWNETGGRGREFISHLLLGGAARGWLMAGSARVLVYREQGREAWKDRLSDHCPVSVTLRLPG